MTHTPAGKHANALVMKSHAPMHTAHPTNHSGGPVIQVLPIAPPQAFTTEPNIMGSNTSNFAIGGPVNPDVRPVAPLLRKAKFRQAPFGNPQLASQTRQP